MTDQTSNEELDRLRSLVRVADIRCEQCGAPAKMVDDHDWPFCGDECMAELNANIGGSTP